MQSICAPQSQPSPRAMSPIAAVLLPLIPEASAPGTLVQVVEIGDGIVTVHDTPDSPNGTHQVTAWRTRRVCDIESELSDCGDSVDSVPLVEYLSVRALQYGDSINAAINEAARSLGAVTDPACPDCPGQATPGHQCPRAGSAA